MRYALVLVVAVTACKFTPPGTLADASDEGSDAVDAPEMTDGTDGHMLTPGCPASYDIDLTAGGFSKYRANATQLSWRQAESACIADGEGFVGKTHLVVFANDAERIAGGPQFPGNSWIGLTDLQTEGTFIWIVVESDPPQSGLPMWANTQPNGGSGDDCIQLNNGDQYDDKPCTDTLVSVCECDDKTADPARFP